MTSFNDHDLSLLCLRCVSNMRENTASFKGLISPTSSLSSASMCLPNLKSDEEIYYQRNCQGGLIDSVSISAVEASLHMDSVSALSPNIFLRTTHTRVSANNDILAPCSVQSSIHWTYNQNDNIHGRRAFSVARSSLRPTIC
jgi:hypothetical protein